MPTAKAVSVAMGMPQPWTSGVPPVNAVNINAGISMPPSAAAIIGMDWSRLFSSPTSSSRLISRPSTKKNRLIMPSLIQWRRHHFDARQTLSRVYEATCYEYYDWPAYWDDDRLCRVPLSSASPEAKPSSGTEAYSRRRKMRLQKTTVLDGCIIGHTRVLSAGHGAETATT
jgi:hypothetical protein